MALNIGDLYVTIGANTDALKAVTPVLSGTEKAINKLSANIEKLNTTLSNMGNMASSNFVKVSKSAQQSANKQVKSSSDIERAISKQEDAMEKAKIAVDNLNLSLGKMGVGKKFTGQTSAALSELEAKLQSGALSTQEFQQANNKFRNSLARTKTEANKFAVQMIELENANRGGVASLFAFGSRAKGASARLSGLTSTTRNLGHGVQNAAYQFQDMLVQFEMGIDTSRILGQQLPQLLGGFGAIGAVAGVGAAALAMIIPAILDSGDESETAAKKVDVYKESLNKLTEVTDALEESQAKLNGTSRDFSLKPVSDAYTKAIEEAGGAASLSVLRTLYESGNLSEDLVKKLKKVDKANRDLVQARVKQADTTRNNLVADLLQEKQLNALYDQYKAGTLSLREYNIQQDIVRRGNELGIQSNKNLMKVLETLIRLEHYRDKEAKKKKAKKEDESAAKLLDQYAKLNSELIKSQTIFENVQVSGTNAGVALEEAFGKQEQVLKWKKELSELKDDQLDKVRIALKMTGASTEELAVAFADLANKTKDNQTALSSYNSLLSETGALADRLSVVTAKGNIFNQMFNPAGAARSADFKKGIIDAKSSIEKEMAKGGNEFYLTDVVDQYEQIARKAGMTNPFEGIDTTNVDKVAEAVARVNQGVSDLEQSPQKIKSALDTIGGQFVDIVNQMSSFYSQQASMHQQMAADALAYGKSQAELYMQLADAVHYSNNEQAKSFENRAIAAATSAAKQYEAEKAAQNKSNAAAKKAFEMQKALQIAQAMMSTATAVANALAIPPPPVGMALAGTMSALGAAQVALIQKQQFTPRETGGSIRSGQAYITSEGGPEIFVPGRSGTMISQKEIMAGLTDGGGKGDVYVTFEVNAIDASGFSSYLQANRGMIINMFRDAQDENLGRGF